MIKNITKSLLCLVLLAGCQTATLEDQAINKFIVSASQGDFSTKIDVSWLNTDYYAYFDVLRSDSENGNYDVIASNETNDLYSDTTVKEGTKYYYKIKGYNSIGTPMYVSDYALGYSGVDGGFYPPDYVESNAGKSATSITLSWNRSVGASEYAVLKGSERDGVYTEIDRTSSISYTDYDVTKGQVYYYRITAYDSDGGPSANSSTPISASVFGTDLYVTTGLDADVVKIQWEAYNLATSYTIYKSINDQNLMGTAITTINYNGSGDLQYIDKDVELDDLYYYTIVYSSSTTAAKSEVVRGYLAQSGAPDKPTITSVSQGTHTDNITIEWGAVDGAEYYEVSRAVSSKGPWVMLDTTESTTYIDREVPDNSASFFYLVTAFNPIPSIESDSVEGWANRPPQNITATQDIGTRVVVSWDTAPGDVSYLITYSESLTGNFLPADGTLYTNSGKIYFDHVYDIGTDESRYIYYKVQVSANGVLSASSDTVTGKVQKMIAPKNLRVIGNKTKTKSMRLLWDEVPGARKYCIYRAILKHKGTDPDSITIDDYSYLGEADNAAFDLSFTYPVRRQKYFVVAVDGDGEAGGVSETETVWRYHVDVTDFAKDVDYTINQAQRQINNFGANGSSGNINARYSGWYEYLAGTSAVNEWHDYTSFEITLDGAQSLSISLSTLSAKMNGTLTVYGIINDNNDYGYIGKIVYQDLNSKEGGYAIGGGMDIYYGNDYEYWDYTKAASEMEALLITGESSPRDPNSPSSGSYYAEVGVGSNYQ